MVVMRRPEEGASPDQSSGAGLVPRCTTAFGRTRHLEQSRIWRELRLHTETRSSRIVAPSIDEALRKGGCALPH